MLHLDQSVAAEVNLITGKPLSPKAFALTSLLHSHFSHSLLFFLKSTFAQVLFCTQDHSSVSFIPGPFAFWRLTSYLTSGFRYADVR